MNGGGGSGANLDWHLNIWGVIPAVTLATFCWVLATETHTASNPIAVTLTLIAHSIERHCCQVCSFLGLAMLAILKGDLSKAGMAAKPLCGGDGFIQIGLL